MPIKIVRRIGKQWETSHNGMRVVSDDLQTLVNMFPTHDLRNASDVRLLSQAIERISTR